MSSRHAAKTVALGFATVLAVPSLVSFWIRAAMIGPDRAIHGSSQMLSMVPGLVGQYIRRAFYSRTLAHCDPSVTIEFGCLFSQAGARLDRNVYIGPHCHLGLVHLEADVLLAAGVHVPSGAATHGTADLSVPIREQPGERRLVTIGEGAWIGSAAVILEDVGRGTIVGAGAVVTKPLPEMVIAGGVPARVIKPR